MRKYLFFQLIIIGLVISGCSKDILVNLTMPWPYVYIPGGWRNVPTSMLTDSGFHFFKKRFDIPNLVLSEDEVTNREYKIFLKSLKDSGKMDLYKKAYPDTTSIRIIGNGRVELYRNRANLITDSYYDDFPVVNISPKGAELYCKWLTDVIYAKSEGLRKLVFRLPTRAEWYYAAKGEWDVIYPGGNNILNERGKYICNFKYINQSDIKNYGMGFWGINANEYERTPCYSDYKAKKNRSPDIMPGCMMKASTPYINDFGLFNMAGNAAELVTDTIHIIRNGQIKDSAIVLGVGGSYNDPAYYMAINVSASPLGSQDRLQINLPSDFVGFRPVAYYIKDYRIPRTKENLRKFRKAQKQLESIQ